MIRFVLTDIEGTTSSITFVHEVLFPYARARMADYVRMHTDLLSVQACIAEAKETMALEQGLDADTERVIEQLIQWIDEDRKHPALKKLQGYIWRFGYENGDFKGHVYEDVLPALRLWQDRGMGLGVYSSGSVEAQQLLFGFSVEGDLNPYFSANFDTAIGHKREPASYAAIAQELGLPAKEILFLSDIGAELDAAKAVGMHTCQLLRPGTEPVEGHAHAKDFSEVKVN
jgi:enolase-phosphatase E1